MVLAAALGLGMSAAQAAPVRFEVTQTGYLLAADNSYGKEEKIGDNKQLGVFFEPAAISLQHIAQLSVNDYFSFTFGTVRIEEDSHSVDGKKSPDISSNEARSIGVSALFRFASPFIRDVVMAGNVFADRNDLADNRGADNIVDYSIHWEDRVVTVGELPNDQYKFLLSLDSVSFTGNNMSKVQTAWLTLLDVPRPNNGNTGGNAVPEPGSLALAGLGLGVAGFIGRRRRQQG